MTLLYLYSEDIFLFLIWRVGIGVLIMLGRSSNNLHYSNTEVYTGTRTLAVK